MRSFFDFISRYLHYLILVAIIFGLLNVSLWGGITVPKSFLVSFVIVFVIFPVMINTKFEDVFAHLKEPRPIFCSLFINFLISPLIAFGLAKIFLSNEPEFFLALMFISLIPTSAMSAAWTSFSGARLATALYLIPANLLFSALIGLPIFLPFFIGTMINLPMMMIIKNILLVFGIPLIVGDLTRRWLIRVQGVDVFHTKIKPNLSKVSALGVLILVFIVMLQRRNSIIIENAHLFLKIIIPVLLYYCLLYATSIVVFVSLTRKSILPAEKAAVIIYTSVARHINISLAIVLSAFTIQQSSLMVLFILVAYIIQVPSLAFFAQRFGTRLVQNTSEKDGEITL